MKYLKITNNGVLEAELIPLMGGTTKASDKFKIGQFGTGLKYTLAFLTRNNLLFHLHCGEKAVAVDVEVASIGGHEYGIICINGHRTSITTQMGMEWTAWMIIRELWCNALDEGGEVLEVVTQVGEPEAGKTAVYVQMVPEVQEVYDNWRRYFVQQVSPMFENEEFAVYPNGTEPMALYKNGVLIYRRASGTSIFHYDIKQATINELREYTGSAIGDISACLTELDERAVEYFMEHLKEHEEHKVYELELDYSYTWRSFGPAWERAIGSAKVITQKSLDILAEKGVELQHEKMVVVPQGLYEELTKQFKGVGALRIADKLNEFFEVHDEEALARLDYCLKWLEDSGYDTKQHELAFVLGVFGDKDVMAQINMDEKTVFINAELKRKSAHDFATVLVEEIEHFNSGKGDCTRGFQTHLLQLYVSTILKPVSHE